MVIDMHGTYAQWSARIEQVPRLEGEEAADVGNQRIDGEEHVGCTSLLHGLAVDVKVEGQCLYIAETLFGNPFADGRRAVKAFAEFPGLSLLPEPALPVACGKVNPHGHGIVVSVGEALGDGFP